jgi:hypothetical protein
MNNLQSLFIEPEALHEDMFIISKDVSQLKEYLRQNPKSLYATPQLVDSPEPKSIIILRVHKKKKTTFQTLINPQILERFDKIAVEETQDQVEGTYLNIRHPKITIAYISLPNLVPVNLTLQGKAAIMFQQAYNLLQGIPISLLGMRIDNYPEYTQGTEEEKQQIISDYIEALKEILEDSKKDEEVHEYIRASEFVSEKIERSVDREIKEQFEEMREIANLDDKAEE